MATATEVRSGVTLLRLANWLSPAFPVGGFAYSAGLERVILDDAVTGVDDLAGWLADLINHGSLWNDAVLLAQAWRMQTDQQALAELSDLGLALAGSAERHQETLVLGEAFVTAARAWPDPVTARLGQSCPYPVAIGAVAGAHGVGLVDVLSLYLNAAVNQAGSVAIRCGLIGQSSALALSARLEDTILLAASRAADSDLSALGGFAIRADIKSLNHEIQHSRLFRS